MQKEEIWAIPFDQAEQFFLRQSDVKITDRGFLFERCSIEVFCLPHRRESFWRVPQTKISMEGPEEDLNTIYRRFFVQFVSAGG